MAFASAGTAAMMPLSPTPLNVCAPASLCIASICIGIASTLRGSWYSIRLMVVGWASSLYSTASIRTSPRPCTVAPWTWPSTSAGFTIRPQSWTTKYLSTTTCPVLVSTTTEATCAVLAITALGESWYTVASRPWRSPGRGFCRPTE